MSIIVAVRKGGRAVMAADSRMTFGDKQLPDDNLVARKIRRVGTALLGITGWSLYEDILDHFLAHNRKANFDDRPAIFDTFLRLWEALHETYPFVKDQPDDADSPFGDIDANFIILNPTGLYLVTSDLGVTAFERYYAIGSGSDYALGALHALYDTPLDADELARRAVAAASAFDVHCGGPTVIEDLPDR